MDEKLFKILKKVYNKNKYVKDKNGYQIELKTGDIFDVDTRTYFYATDILSPDELLYLQQAKYPVNNILHDTHDSTIKKLKEILKHPNITFQSVSAAYICGFYSFSRGRQPILSYLFATSVPEHSFEQHPNGGNYCKICSIKNEFWLGIGSKIFDNYWGYSWNERLEKTHLDLEEFSRLPLQIPSEKDLQVFSAVIDLIRHAPKEEPVSKLEQRIKKARLIPNCDKYKLRGLLITLAELGVMPNQLIQPMYDGFTTFDARCEIISNSPGSPRSDIVLPLSGWRGEYGICEERFQEIFSGFYK